MRRAVGAALVILAAVCLQSGLASAEDNCEVITATHSAPTKGEALLMSQALAVRSAEALKKSKGWRRITMTAQKVPPNPFFKKWRPQVPEEAIYASFAAAKTYSTCFTGVSVPFVCTSGSKVCGYK